MLLLGFRQAAVEQRWLTEVILEADGLAPSLGGFRDGNFRIDQRTLAVIKSGELLWGWQWVVGLQRVWSVGRLSSVNGLLSTAIALVVIDLRAGTVDRQLAMVSHPIG